VVCGLWFAVCSILAPQYAACGFPRKTFSREYSRLFAIPLPRTCARAHTRRRCRCRCRFLLFGRALLLKNHSQILNPKPQTPNPKPQTPNPKPQTPNLLYDDSLQLLQFARATRVDRAFVELQSGGLGFGVWGLGFGVWGLGFGVWGLGFGVWGLGFNLVVRVQCVIACGCCGGGGSEYGLVGERPHVKR
jgi:hypothetical protein